MNILMIGGYGYNDVGDEAQPHAILDNLQKEYGENVKIVMLSPYPEFTSNYHGKTSEPDIVFKERKSRKSDVIKLSQQDGLFEDYKYVLIYAWLRKRKGLLIQIRDEIKKVVDRIEWADVIINSGGGNINSIMFKELLKRTSIHRIGKFFGKKVIVSNQTIGPFYNKRDRLIASTSFNRVDLLTFRDQEKSKKLCEEIGVTNKNLYDAADDAISLYSIPKENAMELIRKDAGDEWFYRSEEMIIGINFKASLNAFKGEGRTSTIDTELDKLVKLSEFLLENYSCKLLLISTDFCTVADDRICMREIQKRINPELLHMTAVLEREYTDYELKGISGCLDIAIGARYHFIVFAASNFVPFLGIASGEYQRRKLEGIANLTELPFCYMQEDLEFVNVENIIAKTKNIIRDRVSIRNTLMNNVPGLVEKSKIPVKWIKNYF